MRMVDHGAAFLLDVKANIQYLTDLAFPRNTVANRAQLCDQCFFGGVTGTSSRSARFTQAARTSAARADRSRSTTRHHSSLRGQLPRRAPRRNR
jgi:hypothetical protein